MNTKIILFIIISLILVVPSTNAQEIEIGEKAIQRSVEVIINDDNELHVKHVVSSSNSPKQVKLIHGTVENLTITDKEGKDQLSTIIGENDAVMVFPSNDNTVIEYDLKDVLLFKDNAWILDFLYLETTTFVMPEKLDLVFVNDQLVYLEDKKGLSCHGCQMTLKYSIDEPRNMMEVNWEDRKFLVEIKTFADIKDFEFDQPAKQISFKTNDSNQHITTVMPLELLWEPYMAFLNNEKISFQQYTDNGTHVWINIKPDTTGEIVIVGATAIPEFPIIAPLSIGFLIIMMIPLIKKFNLR